MSSEKNLHLDEDLLIRAVVNEDDLPPEHREHLSICPKCNANKKKIENDLKQLGQMAKRFAPSPGKNVSLPEVKLSWAQQWSWQWRGAFAVAVAAVFILFVTGIPPLFKNVPGGIDNLSPQQVPEYEELMSEVSRLAENALPPVYMDIAVESDSEFNEEFIEFLVPAVEDMPSTYNSRKTGGKLC